MSEDLTLYALETGLAALIQQLEDADSDEARAELAERVGEYLTAAEEKRDRFVQFLRHLDVQVQFAEEESKRILQRAKAFREARERLAQYALAAMEAAGTEQLEGRTSTLRRRMNPPAVVIDDPLLVPQRFFRWPDPPAPTPDKAEIKKALTAGKEVPGARLERGVRLEIK